MERVLPKTINYLDVLPKAVPSERKRKRFQPANGTQYTEGQTIIIEVADPRHFLDCKNSYLEFTFENRATRLSLDRGGGDTLIRNLRVLQAGNQIMNCQNYNRLLCAVINPVMEGKQKTNTNSLTSQDTYSGQVNTGTVGQRILPSIAGDVGGATNANNEYALCGYTAAIPQIDQGMINTEQKVTFNLPLVGGLFSQDKLIPLPLLREPIQIVIDLENNPEEIGVYQGAYNGGGYRLTDVSYTAELIDVPREVLSMLRSTQEQHGGSLLIQSSNYEYNNGLIPAGTTGEFIVNIPTRKKSIKSLLFVGQGDKGDMVNSSIGTVGGVATPGGIFAAYTMSQSANFLLDNYQIKAGSLVHPPQPVQAPGGQGINGVAQVAGVPTMMARRGEALLELSKAFGFLGTNIGSGLLSTLSYSPVKTSKPMIDNMGNQVAPEQINGADMTHTIVAGADAGTIRLRDITGGDGTRAGGNLTASGRPSTIETTPFALDMEAFQKEAVNSGLDTESLALSMDLVLNINNPNGTQAQSVNLDIWTWHETIYYINMDGTITFSQ